MACFAGPPGATAITTGRPCTCARIRRGRLRWRCTSGASDGEATARRVIDESRRRVRALEVLNCVRTAERELARTQRALRSVEEAKLADAEETSDNAELEMLLEDLEQGKRDMANFVEGEGEADVRIAMGQMDEALASLKAVLGVRGTTDDETADGSAMNGTATTQGKTEMTEVSERIQSKIKDAGRVTDRVRSGLEGVVSEVGSLDLQKLRSTTKWAVGTLSETWTRLNGGQDAAEGRVRVEDTELTSDLRKEIEVLERRLFETSRNREAMLRQEDQLGKLIRAKEIRSMDDLVIEVRRSLAVRVLQLEMERIYGYLREEIEVADEFMEERLLVAEFSQLDEQLAEMRFLVDHGEVMAIQDDQVGSLAENVQFLKARLGLENDLYTTRLSWAVLRSQCGDLWRRTQDGGDFILRGFRLIGGDIQYATKLISKASTGTVLTPREVRTLRRTARDAFTLVPFTIIMITPMTPVGHVLVFSFLQRFVPDFFPSTFSEQRIEFMKRYERMKELVDSGSSSSTSASGDEKAEERESPIVRRAQVQLRNYSNDLHLAD